MSLSPLGRARVAAAMLSFIPLFIFYPVWYFLCLWFLLSLGMGADVGLWVAIGLVVLIAASAIVRICQDTKGPFKPSRADQSDLPRHRN
jgi:hypothetical protein